jgi:hypothetical protein
MFDRGEESVLSEKASLEEENTRLDMTMADHDRENSSGEHIVTKQEEVEVPGVSMVYHEVDAEPHEQAIVRGQDEVMVDREDEALAQEQEAFEEESATDEAKGSAWEKQTVSKEEQREATALLVDQEGDRVAHKRGTPDEEKDVPHQPTIDREAQPHSEQRIVNENEHGAPVVTPLDEELAAPDGETAVKDKDIIPNQQTINEEEVTTDQQMVQREDPFPVRPYYKYGRDVTFSLAGYQSPKAHAPTPSPLSDYAGEF